MANAYLVVRIKGQADVPYWASTTMTLLKLDKKYRATILPAKENTLGMLNKVKHYISWIELDNDLAKDILDKKARKSGYQKITPEDLKELGFNSIDELATALAEGKATLYLGLLYLRQDMDSNEVQRNCMDKKVFLD
jgi:large subunit ribosomal protein L30